MELPSTVLRSLDECTFETIFRTSFGRQIREIPSIPPPSRLATVPSFQFEGFSRIRHYRLIIRPLPRGVRQVQRSGVVTVTCSANVEGRGIILRKYEFCMPKDPAGHECAQHEVWR